MSESPKFFKNTETKATFSFRENLNRINDLKANLDNDLIIRFKQ